MESQEPTLQIRKLRKKLRQIEHLESLERDLTDEELSKCMKKDITREKLLQLLADYNQNNGADIDTSSFSVWSDQSTSISVSETDVNVQFPRSESGHTSNVIKSQEEETQEQTKATYRDTPVNAAPVKHNTNRDTPVNPAPEKHDADRSQESEKSQPKPSTSTSTPPCTEFKQPSPVKKSKKATKDNVSTKNSFEDRWRSMCFQVTELDDHSDLVTAVDCCGTLLVSASRDTTVKIWDLTTLTELRSLGSHTGSVTDVVILPAKQVPSLGERLGIGEDDHVVLSGSVDCSIKVWSANTGELLKDIYTYNPITKLAYCRQLSLIVTASDGGKLELWDVESKESVMSQKAHTDAITGLCVDDKRICTSCGNEGEIKVFEVRDKTLHCIYASENVRNLSGVTMVMRHVRALNARGDNLYYGDDGTNVKILSWKKGIVKKIPNHKEEFGMTDAICFHDNLMFTSAYDLDTGQGYVNVFDVTSEPSYVTSVLCEDTGRILDISCAQSDDSGATFITAGLNLLVWKRAAVTKTNVKDLIPTKFLHELSQLAQDSDLESEVEFTESEDEEASGRGSRRGSHQSGGKGGWGSWCSVL